MSNAWLQSWIRVALATALLVASHALWAVAPVIGDVEVADVTPSSVTLIWDVDQNPTVDSVRVFQDPDATVELTTDFEVIAFPLIGGDPAAPDELAALAAREALRAASAGKGLARVTVRGLTPSTTYYLRARSRAGADATDVPASTTIAVTTADVNTFITRSQLLRVRFQHPDPTGWVVMATSSDTQHPVSSVVGDGAAGNEAFVNLAQMFDATGNNYEPLGVTTITLRIREGGGSISTPSFDITCIDGFAVGIAYVADVLDSSAQLTMIQPASLTYSEGQTIVLAWVDALPPSSEIALYYDTDDTGVDGTQIVAGLNADADGVADEYPWDTAAVADGIYWVYAEGGGVTSYAPAPVAIDRAGTDSDADTMADLWEQLFFGSLANAGSDDTDLDGRIDSVEFDDRTAPITPDFRLRGAAGLNLVSWPIEPDTGLSSADVITQLGGIAQSLARVDSAGQQVETTIWDGAGASGDIFPITAKEGYMLRLAQAYDGVYGGIVAPADANLRVGVNLVGFSALPANYSAFQLLTDLGGDSVVASVARLDSATGRFTSAAYTADGARVGFDFSIVLGESYLINLIQAVNGFSP